MQGPAAFNELIEGSYLFGEYLVGEDIVTSKDGVDISNELHGDDLVSQLVIVLVDVSI